MARIILRSSIVGSFLFLFALSSFVRAETRITGEQVLPDTTKAFLAVPDVERLREQWDATQLGHLVKDPAMQPFVEDLRRQLKTRLNKTGARLGLAWEDLEGIYGGELCIGLIQPWDDRIADEAIAKAGDQAAAKAKAAGEEAEQIEKLRAVAEAMAREEQERARQSRHAMALLVDVTGHLDEAEALLEKVTADLTGQGGKKERIEVAGQTIQVVHMPAVDEATGVGARDIFYGIVANHLIAIDHQEIAEEMIARLQGQDVGQSLASLKAFQVTTERVNGAFGDLQPEVRWFVEPFGMVEVMRAYAGGRKKRGRDLLKILANQGFKAVQGIGGAIDMATGEHEFLQHVQIYAPPVEGAEEGSKYELAARMLNFPNTQNLQPQDWVPRGLATYLTFNWKMKDAFWFAETLVNEYADDEIFRDVLESIKTDPNGPQVDIVEGLVNHLGERATLLADVQLPITPKSERLLVAVELTDPEAVALTIDRWMESDPTAHRREHNGHVIWELINEEEPEVEEITIDGPGFGFGIEEPEVVEEEPAFRPNAAVTVANGHLIVATHVDYIAHLLDLPDDAPRLAGDGEYDMIALSLDKLGAGEDAFRFFTRTDEAYRTTYELLRQGRMPEAESLFGKILNRIFEPEEEGVMREQYIDGSTLPEYQVVRRYLGPAGFAVKTEDDGWSIKGCVLSKDAP